MESQAATKPEGLSRRDFFKSTALVGGCAALGHVSGCARQIGPPEAMPQYLLAEPENVLYSTCLQCHVACPIKAKIQDGELVKISGNAYSPQNYWPHLPYEASLSRAARTDAKLCPKGQTGIQTYYDPYRLRKVLKRAGPRGSNKWRVIDFHEFIDEVVQGGKLFTQVGDNRHYPGFNEVYALRDRAIAKNLSDDAKKVGKGEMSVADFKTKHAAYLDKLVDPDHPDLGPKNNGFVFLAGRIEHGRKELMKWWTHDCLGSVNAYEHTSICEQSHHIAYMQMTQKTTHMKPDLRHTEFVIFWGTGAFSANFGLTPMAEKVTAGKVNRGMKVAVIDPRMSNDAAKADWWLPVKPGADGALAQWMIRGILENERYDKRYLANANRAAAEEDDETTFTNATHLVKIVDGHPMALLTAEEAGVGTAEQVVVVSGGRLMAVDPEGTSIPIEGELMVSRDVNGLPVKTPLQIMHDEAMSRSHEEYEQITGIDRAQMEAVANELTSHGKRAAVELYRGAVQHTDGFYAACGIISLNLLIGNPDWKGGLEAGGSHWHEFGGKDGNIYHYKKMHPDKFPKFGPYVSRERTRYEDTTLFRKTGYPAQRPWYPLSNNVYQEVVPSMAAGYPYPGNILFLHMGTSAYATPAGDKTIEMLMDPDRVPLFIACDVAIAETSMYADYILPDLTYMERWGTPHVTPDINTTSSKVRQPVVRPMTEDVSVDGELMPISLEAFFLAAGKQLGLPGIGEDAFGPGMPFDRPEDWFLKAIVNIAYGDKPGDIVPDADEAEMTLFRKARRHLPSSVFDEQKMERAVRPEEWRKVVYVLNRGGRYNNYETAYKGEHQGKKLGKMFRLFMDNVAQQRNSISGRYFEGYGVYRGQFDAADRPLDPQNEYPLKLISYKEPFGGQSRTIGNYWSNIALQPENKVLINRRDAELLGLRPDQRVRVVSKSNPRGVWDLGHGQTLGMVGQVDIREGIRPGVIGVSWHYGHWAYGANDVEVDGQLIRGDSRRQGGLCANAACAVDPLFPDVPLTDPIGASASFFDTNVRLEPVPS